MPTESIPDPILRFAEPLLTLPPAVLEGPVAEVLVPVEETTEEEGEAPLGVGREA